MELSSWEAYQSNQTFFGSLTAQRVKYYFRKYETARRIAEQQEIERSETYLDPRGTHEDNDISGLLTTLNLKSSGKLAGFNRRNLGGNKSVGRFTVNTITENEIITGGTTHMVWLVLFETDGPPQ